MKLFEYRGYHNDRAVYGRVVASSMRKALELIEEHYGQGFTKLEEVSGDLVIEGVA